MRQNAVKNYGPEHFPPKDLDPAEVARFKQSMKELGEAQEIPEDIEPYGQRRVEWLAGINARRELHDLPPFENDEEGNPELTERRRKRSEEFWDAEFKRVGHERPAQRSSVSRGR